MLLALVPGARAGAMLNIQWQPPEQVVISWPTNSQTYSLQYSTNLSGGGLWQTASTNPALSLSRYVVTDSVAATPRFYRLCLNQPGAAFSPNNPAASGYQLVFHDEFDSASTIDLNATGLPGFNWYRQQFFQGPRLHQILSAWPTAN